MTNRLANLHAKIFAFPLWRWIFTSQAKEAILQIFPKGLAMEVLAFKAACGAGEDSPFEFPASASSLLTVSRTSTAFDVPNIPRLASMTFAHYDLKCQC